MSNNNLPSTANIFSSDVLNNVGATLNERSKAIYAIDTKVFAQWIVARGLTPTQITRTDMLAYRQFIGETYATITAKRMLSVARRLLEEVVYEGGLSYNPATGIAGFSVANESTHVALSLAQAKTLMALPYETPLELRDKAIISMLLYTGIRRSECVALNVGDIKEDQGYKIAVIRHGKGDKRRIAKVPVPTFNAITANLQGRESVSLEAPLFVGYDKGGHATMQRIGCKLIERVVKKYGTLIDVPDLTPHGLRATFITLTMEGGASVHQTQWAAGHASPVETERYHKRKLNLDDHASDYLHL